MEKETNNIINVATNRDGLLHFVFPKNGNPFFFDVEDLVEAQYKYPNVSNVMHDHDFYMICFFSCAKGTHIINFEEFQIEDNMAFFLCPTHVHKLVNMEHCKGYAISFSKDFIEMFSTSIKKLINDFFFSSKYKAAMCFVRHEMKQIIDDDIERIYNAFIERRTMLGYKEYLASLLTQLLIDFQCYGNFEARTLTMNSSSEYKTYMMFTDCIEHNYMTMHKVTDYARVMNLSVSTLNKSVLKVSGKQPSLLINERIMAEAKRLLKFNTAMRIKDIVYELGFDDESNFIKFFKRNAGMSPMRYRDEAHK